MRCVDLFAGWGGFSLAAESAGCEVLWAGNHWPMAVAAHAANHPDTTHVCQDLRQMDWAQLPEYEVLLAAPACQGHSQAAQPSRARSGRTRAYHDALRATAWSVVDCAEVTTPAAIIVENVPDFLRWKLYPQWKGCLEALGYNVAETRIVASHLGTVPQRRDRLFVVATLGDLPDLTFARQKEPAIGPHIDWNRGTWKPVGSARTAPARRRLTAAAERYPRAIVQHVSHHKGLPVSEPIRTVTTQDQWAVVKNGLYRPLTVRENARAMGFPDSYAWPEGATRKDLIKGLGNAVCPPVGRAIIERVTS